MSISSSIALAVSSVTGTGIVGLAGEGEVVLWEDAEQTGLVVEGLGAAARELLVSVDAEGANGFLAETDDIDLEVDADGQGLYGGLGSGAVEFALDAVGYGSSVGLVRLRVTAAGTGLNGHVAVGAVRLRAQVEGDASGTHEHGRGQAALRVSASGAAGLGALGTGSASILLSAVGAGTRGSLGAGTAAIEVSAAGAGWVDGIGAGNVALALTMRVGATGFGASGWSDARGVATGEALVMNAETRALSRYLQFAPNSVAVFQGVLLGATEAGIARLDADTDDALPIEAWVETGEVALDPDGQYRLPQCHVEYRSAGPLELVVTPDGDDEGHIYRLEETRTAGIYRTRVKLGRGVRASRTKLRIGNVDGADFSLRLIELDVEGLSRRAG